MTKCDKCNRKMFIDRQYSSISYLEVYCIYCGSRKFFNPPQNSKEGLWLLQKEILRAKSTISPL